MSDIQNIPNRLYPMGGGQTLVPYDAQLEYLESDTQERIDVNYELSDIGYIGFDVECTLSASNTRFFFGGFGPAGAGASSTSRGRILAVSTTNGTAQVYYIDYGNVSGSRTLYNSARVTVQKHATNVETYPSWASTGTFYLFAAKINPGTGYSAYTGSYCRIRWFKIWNKENVLVRDFIPVRISNIGYMYDLVEKKRYANVSGRGAFIIGPKIG